VDLDFDTVIWSRVARLDRKRNVIEFWGSEASFGIVRKTVGFGWDPKRTFIEFVVAVFVVMG
jgi:hypothetical protein